MAAYSGRVRNLGQARLCNKQPGQSQNCPRPVAGQFLLETNVTLHPICCTRQFKQLNMYTFRTVNKVVEKCFYFQIQYNISVYKFFRYCPCFRVKKVCESYKLGERSSPIVLYGIFMVLTSFVHGIGTLSVCSPVFVIVMRLLIFISIHL